MTDRASYPCAFCTRMGEKLPSERNGAYLNTHDSGDCPYKHTGQYLSQMGEAYAGVAHERVVLGVATPAQKPSSARLTSGQRKSIHAYLDECFDICDSEAHELHAGGGGVVGKIGIELTVGGKDGTITVVIEPRLNLGRRL